MFNFPKELPIDKGQLLTLEPSISLLGFWEEVAIPELEVPLRQLGLEVVRNVGGASLVKGGLINHTRTRIWVRPVREGGGTAEFGSTAEPGVRAEFGFTAELCRAVRDAFGSRLQWIGPAYRLPQGIKEVIVCPLPHALVIRLKPGVGTGAAPQLGETPQLAGTPGTVVELGTGGSGTPPPRLQEITARSAYLNGNHYYEILNPMEWDAYTVRNLLLQQFGDTLADVYFDKMPMDVPLTFIPNDTYFASQWNLAKIDAIDAWNFTTGNPAVVVALVDTGCDLTHPDLQFSGQGINCATMMPPGAEVFFMGPGHGTCTAGIAAAVINNGQGVSGIAGSCLVLPVASVSFSDTELSFGINFAAGNGASVISMSWTAIQGAVLDMALDYALSKDIVLCAAAGNNNTSPIDYPGSYAGVMAIGGTDQVDNRKDPTSPDTECWGASYGEGLSVSAPCVQIWSTDLQASLGFNNDGGPYVGECITYPVAGDAAGDYFNWFGGTSAATPHVAGFAALLRSQYPSLSGVQVRAIIERTADRVGSTPYAVNPGYPNGPWNDQLGYGRINLFKGLDFADVFIKDFPADTGVEPRNPPGGDFWDYSDIVVRPMDDNIFNPSVVAQSNTVVRGQTNYIYVRVTNNGPNVARNVVVNVRITPFVGTQFIATDWTLMDALHVQPASILDTFMTIPAGGQVIAKFSIDATQVETLWGWDTMNPWHPCLLALVQADNDYAFINDIASGPVLPIQINNYAQRNLTVVNAAPGMIRVPHGGFPFIAGHLQNAEESMSLRIDRGGLPGEVVVSLSLDETGAAFPRLRRVTEAGPGVIRVEGGELITEEGKRYVRMNRARMTVTLSKHPGELVPLAIRVQMDKVRTRALISISQLDRCGVIVGGAGFALLAE